MSFTTDVKAVQVTGTGSVFGGTRLRGIMMTNDGATTQSITLHDDGNNSINYFNSVTQWISDCPEGDVFAFNLPMDGILFVDGMTCSAIGADITATVLIDK
jgi:hypothetical protein